MKNLHLIDPTLDAYESIQFSCNNTTWSVGELALAFPEEFSEFASAFAVRICELLESGNVVRLSSPFFVVNHHRRSETLWQTFQSALEELV